MSTVTHIENKGGAVSIFAGSEVVATTPNKGSSYSGPTGVTEALQQSQTVAFWGNSNLYPQHVIDDVNRVNIVPSVLERKVNLCVSGGLQYGTIEYDSSGVEIRKPAKDNEIEDFLDDMNSALYLRESAWDAYCFYNFFPEFQMGRGYEKIVGIGVQDASHVRLGLMDDKGNINKAFIGDWRNISTVNDCDARIHALDPYYRVAQQITELKKPRYILPQRFLTGGQFYYGLSPWNALRANGWLDIARRVPELKKHLLNNLMHIRYHIEINDRYWPLKYKNWDQKTEAEQVELQKAEVALFDKWMKGKTGQGGVYMSKIVESMIGKECASLVVINELKMGIVDGAYLQDVQEVDHIICRDMGLNPAYLGISASKSGSSPGSGSQERVQRTDHQLDNAVISDLITQPFRITARVNKWKYRHFWLASNYVSTLDRTTRAVGSMNTKEPVKPTDD